MKLTLREIELFADGVNEKELDDWKGSIYLAWLNAKLHRVKASDFPKSPEELYPQKPLTPIERAMRNRARMDAWREASNRSEKKKAKRAERAKSTFTPPDKSKK